MTEAVKDYFPQTQTDVVRRRKVWRAPEIITAVLQDHTKKILYHYEITQGTKAYGTS